MHGPYTENINLAIDVHIEKSVQSFKSLYFDFHNVLALCAIELALYILILQIAIDVFTLPCHNAAPSLWYAGFKAIGYLVASR